MAWRELVKFSAWPITIRNSSSAFYGDQRETAPGSETEQWNQDKGLLQCISRYLTISISCWAASSSASSSTESTLAPSSTSCHSSSLTSATKSKLYVRTRNIYLGVSTGLCQHLRARERCVYFYDHEHWLILSCEHEQLRKYRWWLASILQSFR